MLNTAFATFLACNSVYGFLVSQSSSCWFRFCQWNRRIRNVRTQLSEVRALVNHDKSSQIQRILDN